MADTDTPQTPAQDTDTPQAFEVRVPEGVTLDPQVVERWQAQFRAAHLEQSHVDSIVQWHYRLAGGAEQHQQEQTAPEAPSYYDLQAIEHRQQALMGKRHGKEGLSPEEFAELLAVNQHALDMRARWDSQRP